MDKSDNFYYLSKNRSFIIANFIILIQSIHTLSNFLPLINIGIFIWRAWIEKKNGYLPSRWITNLLSVTALVLTYMHFRSFSDLRPTSIFLFSLWGLKILEVRTVRDFKFLTLLCFILICTFTLMEAELLFSLPCLIAFYYNWKSQNEKFNEAALLPRAIPIALFLFLFFPRIQGQFAFKGATKNATKVYTGFSDDLQPGNVTELTKSRELAFRARFNTQNPPMRDQYWVGQILDFGNGFYWKRSRERNTLGREIKPERDQRPSDYTVNLEPHGNRWLFVLDGTNFVASDSLEIIKYGSEFFESGTAISDATAYGGYIGSRKAVRSDEIQNTWIEVNGASQRLRELAKKIAEGTNSREQKAYRILRYYRQEEFKYARKFPKPISTLDQFFFEAKKGFCEHYAAATATLLRAMDVPSRVVIGYQGGDFNSYGNFWKFTQNDAHAWTEFLNDSNLWERIDAVQVVAPERLDLGGRNFAEIPEEEIGLPQSRTFFAKRKTSVLDLFEEIGLVLEGVNYNVLSFLYEFDLQKQKELLGRLGLPTWFAVILGLLMSAMLALILRWLARSNQSKSGAFDYRIIDNLITKHSDKRPAHKTIISSLNQLARRYPNMKNKVDEIIEDYAALSFSEMETKLKRQLQQKLKRNVIVLDRFIETANKAER